MRRCAVAIALVLSTFVIGAGSLSASAAARSREHVAPETTCTVTTIPSADVPWGSVGPGWLIASWQPHPKLCPAFVYLDVVSPTGVQYVLYRLPGGSSQPGEFPSVAAWSGDGSRVSVEIRHLNGSVTIQTLDLQTGAVLGSFSESQSILQGPYVNVAPRFSFPLGTAVLSQRGPRLVRTTFGGAVQTSYPTMFPRVHGWDAAWIESANGTQLAFGATNGIAMVNNNGTIAATLPVTGATECAPVQWWSANVVLASCIGTHALGPNLYEFSTSWAAPRLLTSRPTPPDYGDSNAWRMAGKTLVQVLASCGPPNLGVLHGHRPSLIQPPGVNTAQVIGTTSTSLALVSADCVSGPTVVWYTPASNTSVRVLGPSILGGVVSGIVAFSTATDQGLAYVR